MAKTSENQNNNEAESEAVEIKPQRSNTGLWLGIVILVAILGVSAAGFLFLQQLREKQQDLGGEIDKDEIKLMEMSKQVNHFQSQLAAAQSQIATLQAEITGKESHYDKKLADFSQLHHDRLDATRDALEEAVQKIQRQLGKTRGDWLMADAEYLLSIANQRLHLTGDVKTTMEALTAADQRLRESGDAAAFKVRQQITKEIKELKKVKLPDIVGIYSVLELLEEGADKLALFLPYAGKDMTKSDHKKEVTEVQHEHESVEEALVEFEGLLTIRRTKQPVKSIISQEEAQFIRDQLRVKLEMVKISMVQQNDQMYQATLLDTRQWVKKNFTLNKDADSYLADLDKLSEIQIHNQFPDISSSLKMLRDITKLRLETDKSLHEGEAIVPKKKAASPKPVAAKQPESATSSSTDVAAETQESEAPEQAKTE